MNLKAFQYSLLKYCPSYALGEQVNVGIVFFFREDLELKFIFPTALSRLHSLFPSTDIRILKSYIKNINTKINALSKDKALLEKSILEEILKDKVLTPDSNSLYFDEIKTSKYTTIGQSLDYYYNSYFSVYHNQEKNLKHSDQYLIKQFSDKINTNKKFNALVKRSVKVSNKRGIQTTFDFAWQNGHVNLIKPLSFDLIHKNSIQEKSVKWFGYVTQLEARAKAENLVFNFLVAKPSNKALYKSYEEALTILEDKKEVVELVFEEKIDAYLEEAQDTIQPLEKDEF
jgi:hypothetical protein